MKELILLLVDWDASGTLDRWLYSEGVLSILWVQVIRFWPLGLAMLFPVLRLVPREQFEVVRLEGKGAWREFREVVLPWTQAPLCLVVALTAALSLSEVGASYRVETPGNESFARLLFDRMHAGTDADVASLALVMLSGIALLIGAAGLFARLVLSHVSSEGSRFKEPRTQ